MITLIVGDVPLLQQQALKRLEGQFSGGEIERFYGDEVAIASLLGSCSSLSLFAEKRIIILRRAEKLPKKEQETFLKQLPNLPDEIHFVLIADSIDRRLSLWKTLTKMGELIVADAPPPRERRRWIQQEYQRRKRKITSDALDLLSELAREDFQQVLQVIEKGDLYVSEGESLDRSGVEDCLSGTSWVNVFALTDAIGAKNWKEAFSLLDQLWQTQESPNRILALIVRHFRILCRAVECLAQSKSRSEVASILGIPPFFIDKYFGQARLFQREQLISVWKEFRIADTQLKLDPGKKEWIVERLLFRLRGEGTETAVQA